MWQQVMIASFMLNINLLLIFLIHTSGISACMISFRCRYHIIVMLVLFLISCNSCFDHRIIFHSFVPSNLERDWKGFRFRIFYIYFSRAKFVDIIPLVLNFRFSGYKSSTWIFNLAPATVIGQPATAFSYNRSCHVNYRS